MLIRNLYLLVKINKLFAVVLAFFFESYQHDVKRNLRCILYSFHDTFRNTDPSALESDELASDGIIMDLTYSAERYDLVFNA